MTIGAMTLGTITAPGNATPIFLDKVSFAGDDAYPTGGTAAFQTTFRAKVKAAREILAIVPQDCGVYVPSYDKTNDKLKVRAVSNGAEVSNGTDLSGTTFDLLVISR